MTERIVEFGTASRLTGILNPSTAETNSSRAVLLLLNSGTLHRVGPCRLYVRVARRIAQRGLASLRFDFSGIGDTPPREDGLPFHEYSITEVGEAIDYLSRQGYQRFYLLGICSGADTAWYAARKDSRVNGIILIDGFAFRNLGFYWHHYKARIFDLEVWKNFVRNPIAAFSFLAGAEEIDPNSTTADEVVFDRDWPLEQDYYAGIASLAARNTDSLYVFTGGAANYLNHASQLANSCAAVKKSAHVSVIFWPNVDHMISDTDAQHEILQLIDEWLATKTAEAAS